MKTRQLKTAMCTLHPKKYSWSHGDHHVGAVIVNLEDKKEEAFVIEVWHPSYGTLRSRQTKKSKQYLGHCGFHEYYTFASFPCVTQFNPKALIPQK